MKTNCNVVVLYEDEVTRQEAIRCADALVDNDWMNRDLDAAWASFQDLTNAAKAAETARKARSADFVVFAVQPEGDFSFETLEWIERWLDCREDNREGALVGLVRNRGEVCANKELFLRNLARKIGMDFLTRLPESAHGPIPDSLSSYAERASQVTGVLDEILHRPAPRGGLPPQPQD